MRTRSLCLIFIFLFFEFNLFANNGLLSVACNSGGVIGDSLTLTIEANHEDGISQVWLIENNDYANKIIQPCGGNTSVTFDVSIFQDYEGSRTIEAILWKSPWAFAADTTFVLNFSCPDEYCAPDNLFQDYFSWMRAKGYAECVIHEYQAMAETPLLRSGMAQFLNKRGTLTSSQSVSIDFYDVIPTDTAATFSALGVGEGLPCENNPSWADFCPNPMPAEYLFLENHFKKTFGLDIQFNYHRVEINYKDSIGQPVLENNNTYTFPLTGRIHFRNQLPAHSIVHWAIESWGGNAVGDMTGSSHVAEVSIAPNNALGVCTFTHEWGHTWGLPHSFKTINGVRTYFALDGIMDNTYRGLTNAPDPLDPLERYAFEPVDGYIDDAVFGAAYSNLLASSWQIPVCHTVEPVLSAVEFVADNGHEITFLLNIENDGDLAAGFVSLAAFDNTENGSLIASRVLTSIPANGTLVHQFTLPKTACPSGQVTFQLDYLNEIQTEIETNNLLTVSDLLSDAVAMPKMFLEGAYDPLNGKMITVFGENDWFPTEQPFHQAPWNYEGTERIFDVADLPDNVVDWVLVELYDTTDNYNLVAQRAALLLDNGLLVDVLDLSNPMFGTMLMNGARLQGLSNMAEANYYLAVRSRNHLACMSAVPVSVTSGAIYDFTTSETQAFGSDQLRAIEVLDNGQLTTVFAQYAGDLNSDGVISILDLNYYTTESALLNQYVASDTNMDGAVTVVDYNQYRANASVIGIHTLRY